MKPTIKEHKLTRILRAGDPAAHTGPMLPAEAAHMRARVRAVSRAFTARSWKLWALAAAATAALVVIPGPYGSFPAGTPTKAPPTKAPPTRGPGIESPVATNRREFHFIAPNGTRIIWSLRKDDDRPQKVDDPEVRS